MYNAVKSRQVSSGVGGCSQLNAIHPIRFNTMPGSRITTPLHLQINALFSGKLTFQHQGHTSWPSTQTSEAEAIRIHLNISEQRWAPFLFTCDRLADVRFVKGFPGDASKNGTDLNQLNYWIDIHRWLGNWEGMKNTSTSDECTMAEIIK